jgi:hypothetical protein
METYLKEWFSPDASGTLFQEHLGINLEAAAGPEIWQARHEAAAIRHVLTHNAGVIDAKFRDRMPGWHQALGQRLNITERQTLGFLDALETFGVRVLPGTASRHQRNHDGVRRLRAPRTPNTARAEFEGVNPEAAG